MEEYAVNYQKEHRGSGKVVSVNDYCFVWETLPDPKDESKKTKQTVFMLSYFTKF